MKLVLEIFGKKIDEENVCKSNSDFNTRCLLFTSIERMKLKNINIIRSAGHYEIFLMIKSKMNETK